MNVKTPPILFEDEIKSLLSTIEKVVVHSPLSINEIIDFIPIIAEFSSYGINIKLILTEYLKGMKEKKK